MAATSSLFLLLIPVMITKPPALQGPTVHHIYSDHSRECPRGREMVRI